MAKIHRLPDHIEGRLALALNRLQKDQRTVAERRWRAPLKPKAPQALCDLGLFSDDAKQLDLLRANLSSAAQHKKL